MGGKGAGSLGVRMVWDTRDIYGDDVWIVKSAGLARRHSSREVGRHSMLWRVGTGLAHDSSCSVLILSRRVHILCGFHLRISYR